MYMDTIFIGNLIMVAILCLAAWLISYGLSFLKKLIEIERAGAIINDPELELKLKKHVIVAINIANSTTLSIFLTFLIPLVVEPTLDLWTWGTFLAMLSIVLAETGVIYIAIEIYSYFKSQQPDKIKRQLARLEKTLIAKGKSVSAGNAELQELKRKYDEVKAKMKEP